MRLGPSQDREDLVPEGGVALVRHGVCAQPDGLGVGLHPAVVRRGRAGAIRHLLVHTVGLSEELRKCVAFEMFEHVAVLAFACAHVIIIKVWRLVRT